MPAVAFGPRVVESGPGGENLTAGHGSGWRSAVTVPATLPGQAKALARGRLKAVAVDGKTCRGARGADSGPPGALAEDPLWAEYRRQRAQPGFALVTAIAAGA